MTIPSQVVLRYNPLLLKIFCKVNQGKRGITIHKASLTDCMQKYAEQLIEEVALPKGAGHAGRKIKVENELRKLTEILWEKNVRQLPYSPDYIQIFNDCVVADKLIDEGCCMIEMRDGEAYVQFSYDMIAGYFVAKYIVETYRIPEGKLVAIGAGVSTRYPDPEQNEVVSFFVK